ncbi:DUF3054 domain-containing protein [Corynebacterium tuscaniense]|uniref:DUF3054 domain-containing protein n=1 Tax=Corynebacterium tuscaniense TaxID=302449 RepID=UPI001238D983|nr:DUF3054 domain-containing protein [Corynebacterium tuscaniense]KAA8743350.1 DUF3054 domain-containing protein [Corynebacterium tuscaniense]
MKNSTAITLDAVAIALFALFARIAHQTEETPLNFITWLDTLWPFLLGVALAWMFALFALKEARGWVIWLITVATGLIIWAIRNQQLPHWSFILVASVMSALLMLGWRGIARLIKR